MVKKIIPCLDMANGRVVKGVQFVSLKDAGDPVELASLYNREGADELVFLDISASHEGRKTTLEMVRKVAEQVTIPLTVGGGINGIEDVEVVLMAGASKVSINTAAIKDPELIRRAAQEFSNQSVVVAIDAKAVPGKESYWTVLTLGGREEAGLDAVEWAKTVESLGAGEILLTSMDRDGTKDGYDIALTRAVSQAVSIPVTASGGAGRLEDFFLALTEGKASAALAASVFHYGTFRIKEVKEYLAARGVPVKL